MINDDKIVSTQKESSYILLHIMEVRNDLNLSYEDNGFSFHSSRYKSPQPAEFSIFFLQNRKFTPTLYPTYCNSIYSWGI